MKGKKIQHRFLHAVLPIGLKEAMWDRVKDEHDSNYTAYLNQIIVAWLKGRGCENAVTARTKPFSMECPPEGNEVKFRLEKGTADLFIEETKKEMRTIKGMVCVIIMQDLQRHDIEYSPTLKAETHTA